MSYREEGDQVGLTMSRDQYDSLLIYLGGGSQQFFPRDLLSCAN